MKIELWPLNRVRPYPGNPRKIPQAAIDKIALSITEYGFRQPIVVDIEGVIIVGHVRRLAAQKLGLEQVPVHVAEGLAPEKIRGYRIMDNRSHEDTGWIPASLKTEIVALEAAKFPLEFTGFLQYEIDELMIDPAAENLADAGEGGTSKIVTEPGELWHCGPHRVLCGDSTNAEDVARVLADSQPLVMITDIPYGVSYDPEWREEAGLGKQVQVGKVANDDRVDWTVAYVLFPGDVAYVFHAGLHAAEVATHLNSAGFEIRSQIIWAKQHFALSRGMYHWQHEPAYFAVRKGRGSHWRGSRTQSTLWSVASLNPFGGKNREETPTGHGTQKPLELMRRPMLNHTEPGELVYDPFLGSGTTLIAAEMNNRICHGLEIERKYVDLIVRRWQELTGRPATLEGDGRSFDDVQALRLPSSSSAGNTTGTEVATDTKTGTKPKTKTKKITQQENSSDQGST
jgi:DNA modification methylase